MTQKLEAENVGHVANLHRVRTQISDQLPDAFLRTQWQRDPHLIEVITLEICGQAVDRAEHRHAVHIAARELRRVVVEAAQLKTSPRRATQAQHNFAAKLACSDDADVAQVVASPAQESKRQPEAQTRGRLQHEAASKPYCNPYP